jgi:hypothetical protein
MAPSGYGLSRPARYVIPAMAPASALPMIDPFKIKEPP